MAKFSICTNLTNGAGLQRDYEMLRAALEAHAHTVVGLQFNDYNVSPPPVDVHICLEVIEPRFFVGAKEMWFVPNSEWFMPWWEQFIPKFDRVLCKTKNCLHIWQKKSKRVVEFLGWEAENMYDPNVTRERRFLHLAGKSQTKNTASVIQAWNVHSIQHPLTVVAGREEVMAVCQSAPKTVTVLGRQLNEDIIRLMNSHIFHILPSQQEGFGMALHEAQSCGATIITTDAPSMNELQGLDRTLQIPPMRSYPLRADTGHAVSLDGVNAAVYKAWALAPASIENNFTAARHGYLDQRNTFRRNFELLMECLEGPQQ